MTGRTGKAKVAAGALKGTGGDWSGEGKMGKMGNLLDKPSIQRTTAWIGLLGFLIGKRMFVAFPMIFDS